MGAGAGAVTGAQIASATGPGAFIGAGFGAVAGGVRGAMQDVMESQAEAIRDATEAERARAFAQERLAEHYQRRIDLHPTRDIFPADWFFYGDEARLRPEAMALVDEIARMNKERLPWSRLVITSYVKSSDRAALYSRSLAQHRAREIFNQFVRAGVEPRRLVAKGVILEDAILVDPEDVKDRYSQAIEIVLVDR